MSLSPCEVDDVCIVVNNEAGPARSVELSLVYGNEPFDAEKFHLEASRLFAPTGDDKFRPGPRMIEPDHRLNRSALGDSFGKEFVLPIFLWTSPPLIPDVSFEEGGRQRVARFFVGLSVARIDSLLGVEQNSIHVHQQFQVAWM